MKFEIIQRVVYFFQIKCANPENRIMVIACHNFRGHVNVLIYTGFVGWGGGGVGRIFGFRATEVQKESDV